MDGNLYTILSTIAVLRTKIHNYHVNLVGQSFKADHDWFGELYSGLDPIIDILAERMRQCGDVVDLSFKGMLRASEIDEAGAETITGDQAKSTLAADYKTICDLIYKAIEETEDDHITENILQDIGHQIDKTKWMLLASTNGKASKKSAFTALEK